MSSTLWLRLLAHRWLGRRGRTVSATQKAVSSRRRVRPCLEILEDRTVPATFYLDPGNVGELVADINTANTNGQANVINLFNNSTYDLTKIDNYWYGPNGLPPITSNLTIHGNGAIIQRDPAQGTSDFRLFYVSGGMELNPGSLTMDNVTLKNGIAKGGDSYSGGGGLGAGGAIFNQGTLNLTAVTFVGNTAQGGSSGVRGSNSDIGDGGGGMGQDAPEIGSGGGFGGSVGNYGGAGAASPGGGGGGFLAGAKGSGPNGGGLGGFGSDGGDGGTGAIEKLQHDMPYGYGGNFGQGGSPNNGSGNGSFYGGGGGVGGGGAPSLEADNAGGGGFGGGGGGGNVAAQGGNGGFGGGGGGGGVSNGNGGTIGGPGHGGFGGGNGSFGGFGGGGAGMGGAIFNMGADSAHSGCGTATLVNCTLTNNTAQGGSSPFRSGPSALGQGLGGALFNLDGNVTLTNDTVSGNHASFAGHAVYNLAYGNDIDTGAPVQAELVLNNNILANTGGTFLPDLVSTVQNANLAATATVSGTHNLVMLHAGTINPGVITQIADPMLGPLQNNGGLTPTMKPQSGSPVLGGGDHSVAPGTDQRGVPRRLGPLPVPIDLGSVQVSGAIAPPPNLPLAPPSPPAPSALHRPPLLGFLDALLAGVETVNGNGTETVVDSIFGIPLFISLYDSAGKLMSVTLFGIDITFLVEML